MKHTDPQPNINVKDRLLDTADRLFYLEGIRAVGIDRILLESGAAKASLYKHFGNKDGLVAACVQRRIDRGRVRIVDFMEEVPPADRALRYFDWIIGWVDRQGFRGCPMQHVVSELQDFDHPARRIAAEQRAWVREQVIGWLADAGVQEPTKLAGAFAVLADGALAASEQDGPERARDAQWIAKQLIESHR